MTSIVRSQNIRWLILVIIFAQRSAGATDQGGWMDLQLLRRLLAAEGYPLEHDELQQYLDYLEDSSIACVERKGLGDVLDRRFKVKLTAKGMRAAMREEKVIGVGVGGDE